MMCPHFGGAEYCYCNNPENPRAGRTFSCNYQANQNGDCPLLKPRRPADLIYPNRIPSMLRKVCVSCGGDASEFKDALSKKEYGISGLCQTCQDKTFR